MLTKNQVLTPAKLRHLFQLYAKTLDNNEKDEGYCTEREEWNYSWKGFLEWYKKYQKTDSP